jgi:predicted PurR-regulated permease PerM
MTGGPGETSSAAGRRIVREASSAEREYGQAVTLVLAGALAYILWRIIGPLWHPLTWAILIGILLAPLNRRLADRFGNRPGLASVLTLTFVALALLLPATLLLGEAAAQAAHLHALLDASLGEASRELTRFEHWLAGAGTALPVADGQVHAWLVEGSRHLLGKLASSGGVLIEGVLGGLMSIVLMLFVLFFVLRDGPVIAREVLGMLPVDQRRRSRLQAHMVDVTRAVFRGIGLTALVHGALVGFGCWMAGLPSPLVLGLLAALLALIPVVGSALVWVPCVLLLVSRGEATHAALLSAWCVVVVGAVDHVMRPLLISGRAQVPAVAVFIGVLGGLAAFGFIGVFIGPIALGLLVAIYRFETEARIA